MKITIINTGCTFNKEYNLLKGALDVKSDASSLEGILKWTHNIDFEIINILAKDSLEINDDDRDIIIENIICVIFNIKNTFAFNNKYIAAALFSNKHTWSSYLA